MNLTIQTARMPLESKPYKSNFASKFCVKFHNVAS